MGISKVSWSVNRLRGPIPSVPIARGGPKAEICAGSEVRGCTACRFASRGGEDEISPAAADTKLGWALLGRAGIASEVPFLSVAAAVIVGIARL